MTNKSNFISEIEMIRYSLLNAKFPYYIDLAVEVANEKFSIEPPIRKRKEGEPLAFYVCFFIDRLEVCLSDPSIDNKPVMEKYLKTMNI